MKKQRHWLKRRKQESAETVSDDIALERKWLKLVKTDPRMFLYFYDKYYDMIYRHIFWRTLDADATEDLTAETFFKALEGIGRYRWQGIPIGAWLYRIAIREALQYNRRISRRIGLDLSNAHDIACPRANPLMEMILTEEQQILYECLDRLGEEGQNLILLRYWDNLGLGEIAAILDLTIANTKTKLHRYRNRLALLLRESEHQVAENSSRYRLE
jgi:RNA polymerase sigma-70 factor (ECF subfamily)